MPLPTGKDFLDQALTAAPLKDAPLRPSAFKDFTGQTATTERLKIMVGAAKKRGEALGHVLLSGPPGLGKTTLALLIGGEMGKNVKITSGPVLEKAADLAGILTSLENGEILFIDEIHRMPKTIEEYLYSAMEDFRIDILLDAGPNARSVRLDLPRFTLIGATTRSGLLSAPLRNRFTLHSRLDYYDRDELTKIVERAAKILDLPLDPDAARELAGRARGTPRVANNLLYFVRDYAQEKGNGHATLEMTKAALELLAIDPHGLDELDKRLLGLIANAYNGGPVGVNTLAAALGEEPDTLEEVHEPYLLQEGYLQRTPQGRILTIPGYQIIGKVPSARGQQQTLL
jgi:holliday junction DNA helicase RuvB